MGDGDMEVHLRAPFVLWGRENGPVDSAVDDATIEFW